MADFHTLLEVFGLQYDHTLRPDTFYHGILGVGAVASFIQMKESPRFGELTMQCPHCAHPDSIHYGTSGVSNATVAKPVDGSFKRYDEAKI